MLSALLATCGSSCLFIATWHHICHCCIFAKKVNFLNFENKKKSIWKVHPFGIKFHKYLVIALGIIFRKNNIYFLFYFQNLGGSLPASSSASARCTDVKKKETHLFYFLPAMFVIVQKTIKKKKWNLIPLRRAYEWPKESARTSTRLL